MAKTVLSAQTATLRDLLKEISEYALEARKLDPHDDNLPDRIDDIDAELQKVIELPSMQTDAAGKLASVLNG